MSFRTAATLLCAAAFFPCVIDALPSSLMPDGTVIHGGQPFFPLGLYAENEVPSTPYPPRTVAATVTFRINIHQHFCVHSLFPAAAISLAAFA